MSSIRFKGDISDEIGSDSIHYDKFLNKVKKRQLKMEEEGEKLIRKKYKDNVRCVNEKLVDEPAVSRVNGSDQFTRIGASNQLVRTNIQLKPVLPNWILNPIIIPINAEEITDEMPKFHDRITANLLENNIVNYFPVQRKVIPWIMNQFNSKGNLDYIPQDGCVCAPTGSGKTLAYVLPIVQILLGHFLPRIRCLVLVPVQQLAIQVAKVFRSIIKGTSLKVAAIYGGNAPLKVEQEMLTKEIKVSEYSSKYETVIDILVITPGKLVEHLQKTKGFDLSHLKFLVIDEADRMMENVQNDWLFYLQKHLDNQPISHLTLNHRINKISKYQKLLFSATLSTDAERLKKLNLFQPVLFAAMKHNQDTPSKFVMPEQLKQYYLIVEPYLKPAVIAELISGHKWRRVLCFCKSAVEADRLSNLISQLCPDIKVRDISSKIPNRVQLIHEFSVGHIDLLICTDIMGRGIDIPNVRHVISYDPAKHFKGYVHRAGRTARAGTEGTVLTLLSNDQANSFIQTLRHNNKVNINELELSELALEKKSKLMEKILQCFHGSTKASNTYTNSNKSKAKNRRPQIKQSIVL